MRIVHVVGTISWESSGPSQSVPALCRGLVEEGCDVELHYLDYGGRPVVPGVRTVVYDRTRIPGLRFAAWNSDLLLGLWRRAKSGTIFHAHGLWHFPTIYPAWVGSMTGTPWVCSPRGTLGEWTLKRSAPMKAISSRLGQKHALEHAALLHATSDAEGLDMRRFGLTRDLIVVPNAVTAPAIDLTQPRTRDDLLFMSRLHPVKGLDRLIDAWQEVARSFPNTSLLIAGPSEGGYGEALQVDVRKRGIPRVRFLGSLVGVAKWRALAQARALVLPSHSENFAMVIAEALSVGTPVIASKGTPWASLPLVGAGWWVENSVPELMSVLRECLSESVENINLRGERGRLLAAETYSPRAIARAMIPGYERVLAAKAKQ